jgi:PAS domain S-box-containing protein
MKLDEMFSKYLAILALGNRTLRANIWAATSHFLSLFSVWRPAAAPATRISPLATAGICAFAAMALMAALLVLKMKGLRKQNAFLSGLFELSPQAVALTAANGRLIRINREFSQVFGYAPQEALGRRLGETIVPDESQDEYRKLVGLAAQGVRVDAESLRRRKDVSRFRAAITRFRAAITYVPSSPGGGEAAIYAAYRDLTQQKRSEQAWLANGGCWRAVFDNSAVGIAVTDTEGRFIAANCAYREMLGYSRDELRGISFIDLTFEDDRAASGALYAELELGKRQQFRVETRCRRKDGQLIWVRATVSGSSAAGATPPLYIGIVEDITKRKLAMQEYEKVVEHTREMVLVFDREYRQVIANQAFLNYRGLKREQVVGHHVAGLVGKELFENVLKPKIDECFQGKTVEFEIKRPSSIFGERDLFVTYFPIEGARGVERVAGVVQDITEQKRSREELQKSFDQLRALTAQLQSVREEERTRLARELHDELGQALTAIKIDLASLQAAPPGEQLSGNIGAIMNFVDRTIHSVRRIATELRPGILDDLGLVAAVDWAAAEFQTRTGIECQMSVPDTELAVDSERATALFRVFQETLTNVARHSGATRVNIRLGQNAGDLFLEVQDNGRGMGNTNPNTGSMGILGMRERARLLGGGLEIASDSPGGTTIRVQIPNTNH